MKLTKQQFINQFPYQISNAVELQTQGILIREQNGSQDYEGVEVWRALQTLMIRVDGKFYGSH